MELIATCSQPHLGLPLRRTIRGDALRKQDPEQDPPQSITQCSPFVRVTVEFVWRDGGSKGPWFSVYPEEGRVRQCVGAATGKRILEAGGASGSRCERRVSGVWAECPTRYPERSGIRGGGNQP